MSKIHPLAEVIGKMCLDEITGISTTEFDPHFLKQCISGEVCKWLEEKSKELRHGVITLHAVEEIKRILELTQEPEWCEHIVIKPSPNPNYHTNKYWYNPKDSTGWYVDERFNFCPECGAKRPG